MELVDEDGRRWPNVNLRAGDGKGEMEDGGSESYASVEKKSKSIQTAVSSEAGVCSMLFALAVEVVGEVISSLGS